MTYTQLQQERGRRGGIMAAKSRRITAQAKARALDAQWPRCPDCGARTHLGVCPACENK